MNMNSNPTSDQLKSLLAAADDNAAHHMLWVGFDGEVHLDRVPEDRSPVGYYEDRKAEMKTRLETFQSGNDYVGEKAAEDKAWVSRLFNALTKDWESGATGYNDVF
jgi:hypothetical protein